MLTNIESLRSIGDIKDDY